MYDKGYIVLFIYVNLCKIKAKTWHKVVFSVHMQCGLYVLVLEAKTLDN